MKKFLESRLFKMLSIVLLFVFGGVSMFMGVYLMFPYISFEGRGVLTFFPLTLVCFFPIFSFVFRWLYVHLNGQVRKWRVQWYYSIIGGAFMLCALIWHIISISTAFHWQLYKGIFPLFPFDILAVIVIYLAICVLLLVKSLKEREGLNYEEEAPKTLKKRSIAAVIAYSGFAAYYYGGALFFFSLIGDHYFDDDFFFIIGVVVAFLSMAIGLVLFAIYRHQPNGNKRKFHKLGLIIMGALIVVDVLWIASGYIFAPYFVPHSISGLFPFGYAAKMPIGLFLLAAWVLVTYIIALVRYFKNK